MQDDFLVEPLPLRFTGKQGLADLERYLTDSSSARPMEIRRPEDILLSLDGLVQQTYRLTPWGLWSLCRRLSPNLGSVVADFSGSLPEHKCKGRADIRAAVSVLNTAIKLRFKDSLCGCRMIVDQLRRTIDGIVGVKYEFFGNHELLRSTQRFAKKVDAEFLSAMILGRCMQIRYIDQTFHPLQRLHDTLNFRKGYHFANSETGQSSVKASLLVVDDNGRASQKPVVKHRHTKGLEGGDWLVEEMEKAARSFNFNAILKNVYLLHSRSFPRLSSALGAAAYAEKLSALLAKKIVRTAAKEAVKDVFSPTIQEMQSGPFASPQARGWFDLYTSLTGIAEGYTMQEQENIEVLAYELLRGRFQPIVHATKKLEGVEQ